MAKGWKLTTSLSERYLGTYSYGSNGHIQGSNGTDSSELGEEDVWSMVDGMAGREDHVGFSNNSPHAEWTPRTFGESNASVGVGNHHQIPRDDRLMGGLSQAFEDSGRPTASPRIVHQHGVHHMATSAPVNVPDWSKILRVDSVDSLQELDDGLDDGDPEMVPPHEYLARSRKIAATSVFEGVGRTLKGRDMRRIRDAVWSQTGFDG
ncbi:uncharacterized protein LOC108982103 isoform X2 [Juglans regia]|uniref:Uncharacterized protein LOC108982103 isoform X2 n=1 Tax=Juglans regia TaxID=51240 RepID=A0A6P9ESD2_JUGRE|nr:uncharacterized protein LOC108982103 isoform X2 [Juglans regia]